MMHLRRIRKWLQRMFTWYFSTKVLVTVLVLAVSAASIIATTKNYQAEIGGALNVTNSLVATDKGLSRAASTFGAAGISCSSPVIFGASVANNAVTLLDFVYNVRVNETLMTSINTCFKATLVITPNGGSATTYGPVYMNSTAPSLVTNRVDCQFDIGISIPSSPYSFQLTVQ
jgi:hypothetical protein